MVQYRMGDVRDYAAKFIEDSLGLALGQLDKEMIPSEFIDIIRSIFTSNGIAYFERPYIEEKVITLLRELERMIMDDKGFFVRKERWPNAKNFAVALTHDVDNISRPISHIISRWRRFKIHDLILAILHIRSLYDNIDLIKNEEGKRGFRSSFYFLLSNYGIDQLSKRIKKLREDGWDIGLHGSIGTHVSLESMMRELKEFEDILGFKPIGVREHYLSFEMNNTWEIMERAGFTYDTTLGLRDRLGFPNGFCTPFHPPSKDWEPLKLIELPLTIMDTTLWGYMHKDEEGGMSEIRKMLGEVKNVNGLFTLLWHQEAMRMRGGRLYTKILDALPSNCFISSAAGIARWWESRSIPIVFDGKTITSIGDAPVGLSIYFKSKDEYKLMGEGCSIINGDDSSLIIVESGRFKVSMIA